MDLFVLHLDKFIKFTKSGQSIRYKESQLWECVEELSELVRKSARAALVEGPAAAEGDGPAAAEDEAPAAAESSPTRSRIPQQ